MLKYIAIIITTLFTVSCNNGTTKNQENKPEYTPEQVVEQVIEPQKKEPKRSLEEMAYNEVPFLNLDESELKISDFKGKRVLLNFWATWCRPCVAEMPSMNKAYEILKGENYIFLAASNERISKINGFAQKEKYNFTFLKADDEFRPFNIRAIPTTLIFDTNGEVALTLTGSMAWDEKEILDQLKAIK